MSETDQSTSPRVQMRTLEPNVAVQSWDQVILGYDRAEAIAEARRSRSFDLDRARVGCPFHVDVRQLVEHIARGEWDAAVAAIHQAHPFPQILGMHCHRYCEIELTPGAGPAGADRPRRERVEPTPIVPFVSALEWAAGRYGVRPAFQPGKPTGNRVAIVGAGTAGLMCAWELRHHGHAVDVYDRERLPSGLLWTGYPSFRMNKSVVLEENDPHAWGATFHAERAVSPDGLRRMVDDYDAVFFAVGRTPLRSFGGIEGEDLDGILAGLDVMREVWYGGRPSIGPRVLVFGGGFSAFDVARTARRLDCSVQMLYRRGPAEMPVGGRGTTFIRMLESEGITVRTMVAPKRFIGRDGRVAAVELVRMTYGDLDASGRRATHPIADTEEIVEVDTVLRSIGEVCDVSAFAEPLGIDMLPEGFIRIDPVSRRTAHPKVWAGGDVAAGFGNHGAAFDGLWAGRSIHAFLEGRHDAWQSEAAVSDDADLLVRAASMR
ncbi:MAG: FAD-dependent oxidoreductase [Chloroflexi bacterium]|nr:FAD-dependent oxidoreductase [Chloroflexota bacterium]